ncbi:MAG: c-type cytochrome [Hyphomonadaceae bacterium]|nr:c-type cytochrome [Hyphomonadaceae bacterium]
MAGLRGCIMAAVIAIAPASIAQVAQPLAAPPVEALTGDPDAGAEFYATECKGCHAVSIAPTLRGVIGRPVASVAGFSGYSEALKAKAALAWTPETLDIFLKGPMDFAPGTLMTKAIEDAQVRADVIAYIATLPPPRS